MHRRVGNAFVKAVDNAFVKAVDNEFDGSLISERCCMLILNLTVSFETLYEAYLKSRRSNSMVVGPFVVCY